LSISNLKLLIDRFLATSRPEVLCIQGAWGIGKTHAWNQAIKEARTSKSVPLDSYAYISLFGLNSLDELKQAIFDNSVSAANAGLDATFDTFEDLLRNSKSLGKRFLYALGTRLGSAAAHTGAAGKFIGSVGPGLFLSVRNRLICIDDIERRGEKLKIGDVLGLVSFLKEQRKCKIVFLLNDKAIDEEGKATFNGYLEKVVDISFQFRPSAQNSCDIALPNRSGLHAKTADLCIKLDIVNIRIISKISRFVDEMSNSLEDFDDSLIDQAISTIVLLCWIVYDPANAPSLTYLKDRNVWESMLNVSRNKLTHQELIWEKKLQSYGFSHFDDLDTVLLDGIQNGIFEEQQIKTVARSLQDSILAKRGEAAFHNAWGPYRDSLENNQEAFLDGLYQSFKENFRHVSPVNLSGTITLFKELGRAEQATEFLSLYTSNIVEASTFDMKNYPFASDVKDPDVIFAFNVRYRELTPTPDPQTTFLRMIEMGQYQTDDMNTVARLETQDFISIFHSLRGKSLRDATRWVSDLKDSSFADEALNRIKLKVEGSICSALEEISRESELNRRRLAGVLRS
jgi:hypothetical protein